MFPPHLPRPASSLWMHEKWQRLKLVCFVVVIGLVAGGSGAAMFIGWGSVVFEPVGGALVFSPPRTTTAIVLDDTVQGELRSRLAVVYASEIMLASGVRGLDERSKLAEAWIVGSDGWIVFWHSGEVGTTRSWRVLTPHGDVYRIKQVLPDKQSGLVYARIVPEAVDVLPSLFAAAPFINRTEQVSDVFAYTLGEWQYVGAQYPRLRSFSGVHRDSAPREAVPLNRNFPAGTLVATEDGKAVGIVGAGDEVIPAVVITAALPTALFGKVPTYPTLGIEGWFNEEQPVIVDGERTNGFAISDVKDKAAPFKRGDVLVAINGQVASFRNVWYTLMTTPRPQSVQVTVVRGGKNVSFSATVKE